MRSRRPLFFGILLVSMAMLSLETLLPRIFAVYVGPNFVYFSISIALVGLSSGGILASLWEERFSARPHRNLVFLALLFSVSSFLAIWLVQAAGNELNQVIDTRYAAILADSQSRSLSILSRSIVFPSMAFVLSTGLLLAVPFLFAGLCISLAFRFYSKFIGKIYAYDLVGAGLGCAFTVASLTWFSATTGFLLIGLLSAVGGLLLSLVPRQKERLPFYLSAAAFLLFAGLFAWGVIVRPPFEFHLHKYAHLRSFSGTPVKELAHRWTPLGRIALLNRQWSPPLNQQPRLRPKYFVAMDLGGHSVIEQYSPANLSTIKHTSVFSDDIVEPIVVPGWYRELRDYLILMAGNGQDMLRAYAWYGDSIRLQGVELNPVVYELGFKYSPAHLRAFFDKPKVQMAIAEGRTYVERSRKGYDLILLSYSGATFASGTGSLASTPQFLFTKEAYLTYVKKLNPGGVLVIAGGTSPGHLPSSLKSFAAALKEFNPDADPRRHVLCYRRNGAPDSEFYTIYHRDPLTREEVERIQGILASHHLELTYSAYTPSPHPKMENFRLGHNPDSARSRQWFHPLAEERVHTDNQPFYYLDLVWGSIGGYLVLGYVATLFSALAVAVLFLLVPLFLSRNTKRGAKVTHWYDFLAFALLGTGFMLIEVGSIQKFELFLGNPQLTLVVILAVLLIFAGVGSFYSSRLFDANLLSVRRASLLVVLCGFLVLFFLNYLIYPLMALPTGAKIGIIAAVLLPLGFFLGTLFPQLIRQFEPDKTRFIPVAWAINGVSSVAAANLGTLLYLFLGASSVVFFGLLCYAVLGLAATVILIERGSVTA